MLKRIISISALLVALAAVSLPFMSDASSNAVILGHSHTTGPFGEVLGHSHTTGPFGEALGHSHTTGPFGEALGHSHTTGPFGH